MQSVTLGLLGAPVAGENGSRRFRLARLAKRKRCKGMFGIFIIDTARRNTRNIVREIFRASRDKIERRSREGASGSKMILLLHRRRVNGSVDLHGKLETIHNCNVLLMHLDKGHVSYGVVDIHGGSGNGWRQISRCRVDYEIGASFLGGVRHRADDRRREAVCAMRAQKKIKAKLQEW